MTTCPVLILLPSLSAAGYEAKQAFALIWDSRPSVPMSGARKLSLQGVWILWEQVRQRT